MIIDRLQKRRLITPPSWMANNTHYLVIMGSQAYGVSQDTSDIDYYGFCIPPREIVFPHLSGAIPGFGPQPEKFEQYQQHHVKDEDKGVEYDFTIYNVVKYMQLVAENNPNMIDSLFVPINCITHITSAGQLVRDKRREFLHKGSYHKFKGYAYSQIHKVRTKEIHDNMSTKRKADIELHGYDTKFASHCIRLLDECEQILTTGDIDLQRNREQLKTIRRGEWTLEYLLERFAQKEKQLEQFYADCTLPHGPDFNKLKVLLLEVLESHYGSLSQIAKYDRSTQFIAELEQVISKYR